MVQVGLMRRFDPVYVELRKKIASWVIGSPVFGRIAFTATSTCLLVGHLKPPCSAQRRTIFLVMPWVFDREVVSVNWLSPTPATAALRDPQVVILELEGGALVFDELFVKSRYGYEIRCEIVGESGTVELAPTARVAVRSGLKVSRDVPPDFRGRFADAYRHELQAWVDAISRWHSVNAEGCIGPVDGPDAWDGYRVAVISHAVLASMSKNAPSVVDFVPMPDLYRQCRAHERKRR